VRRRSAKKGARRVGKSWVEEGCKVHTRKSSGVRSNTKCNACRTEPNRGGVQGT
jgi:hypothetical protein